MVRIFSLAREMASVMSGLMASGISRDQETRKEGSR